MGKSKRKLAQAISKKYKLLSQVKNRVMYLSYNLTGTYFNVSLNRDNKEYCTSFKKLSSSSLQKIKILLQAVMNLPDCKDLVEDFLRELCYFLASLTSIVFLLSPFSPCFLWNCFKSYKGLG